MEQEDVRLVVDGLIQATLDNGAPDNVTALGSRPSRSGASGGDRKTHIFAYFNMVDKSIRFRRFFRASMTAALSTAARSRLGRSTVRCQPGRSQRPRSLRRLQAVGARVVDRNRGQRRRGRTRTRLAGVGASGVRDPRAKQGPPRLACLGAAVLRTEGLGGFARVLGVAADWTTTHWDAVFRCRGWRCPVAQQRAQLFRRSAGGDRRIRGRRSCLIGKWAGTDSAISRRRRISARSTPRSWRAHRRAPRRPTIRHRGWRRALADRGHLSRPGRSQRTPRTSTGSGTVPAIDKVLRARLKVHPDGGEVADDQPESAGEASAAPLSGVITSRQDANPGA
jgi:hypothetical protein